MRSIRILSAALAVVFILTGLALPGWAASDQEPIIKLKPDLSKRFRKTPKGIEDGGYVLRLPIFGQKMDLPNMTTLERMEYTRLFIFNAKLTHQRKQGKAITFGKLTVTSEPVGAQVWISSYTPKGATPLNNDRVLSGRHRITVRKQGYYEQARMVTITPDTPAKLDFKLKSIPYARLSLEVNPPDTNVAIVGWPEKYTSGMKIAPGSYVVEFSRPGLDKKWLCLSLGDDEVLRQKIDLDGPKGGLWVSANQPGCVVYLDGREVGRNSLSIVDLLPGPHKLQVWKSLFEPVTQVVRVRSSQEERVSISLKPVEHFTNSLGMEFVKIPAGSFMMGYRDDPDVMAAKDEDIFFPHKSFLPGLPRHRVEITKPFFMQTTEVTEENWRKIMGSKIHSGDTPVRPLLISKIDEFIARMNERDQGKYRYRLPTEAEWEYACRAGTDSPFYTGETINYWQAQYQNWTGPYGDGAVKKSEGTPLPKKVRSYAPNPWGLYDMHGNARELCADVYDPFFNTYAATRDPVNLGTRQQARTVRGGDEGAPPVWCMCAHRSFFVGQDDRDFDVSGFRLVAEKLQAKRP
ncbi:MAG: SUMF1/EgtB/PvdO family nonheme iron enzyme [Proteobacteria bacterium]|nr:SUMF1/EgtB/PvdO family nonheme iron enzyme [Pseudomonadota bacterium]MBU1449490.1 SUMF1/EgtB/PvdO family nonheme iron enzyme [Pseudomonadota bacterium]MBU2470681.1 SUMF1/EgtB/PvdO family nonheme iron enzyme [Pseudomonadota bacterium]MBU2517262.1 SUMF1/EgtB/PvdO family nonheme iron enzyme [Pseudomonadota bacterium]